jgi:hypothetical protein
MEAVSNFEKIPKRLALSLARLVAPSGVDNNRFIGAPLYDAGIANPPAFSASFHETWLHSAITLP